MKERVENILKGAGIPFKEVLVLGSYIHMSFHSNKSAMKAAVLFPRSHYTINVFRRYVETPHGKRKYGTEWKAVARVKKG